MSLLFPNANQIVICKRDISGPQMSLNKMIKCIHNTTNSTSLELYFAHLLSDCDPQLQKKWCCFILLKKSIQVKLKIKPWMVDWSFINIRKSASHKTAQYDVYFFFTSLYVFSHIVNI